MRDPDKVASPKLLPRGRSGKGYLFENDLGEQVRLMNRAGGWDARIMSRYGKYLDEFGNAAGPDVTHGIGVTNG